MSCVCAFFSKVALTQPSQLITHYTFPDSSGKGILNELFVFGNRLTCDRVDHAIADMDTFALAVVLLEYIGG